MPIGHSTTSITRPRPCVIGSLPMDPPLLPIAPQTILATADLTNSSPRSRNAAEEFGEEHLPPVPGAKMRLMCSYGGHIIPRPNDKTLWYVGGDTRIVVIDRHSSLAELSSRLSRTLLNGRSFTLKYQLPSEELDSLISVATDEDLENMIDEYDRIASAKPLKSSRLRLFLFPTKPETAASMGALLDDAKSETWFVDALNSSGFLPRGQSDSATINNLLELDRVVGSDSCTDLVAQIGPSLTVNKQTKNEPDVHISMPDSPLVETSSSFGSSSSTPSMVNLPPIKVRIDDGGARLQEQMVGLDEQFLQMDMSAGNFPKQEDHRGTMPHISTVFCASPVVTVNSVSVPGDHGRGFSDDDSSDHGVPSGLRKPPLPLQPVQRKHGDAYNLPSPESKHAGGYNLPSPDSVASDSSIASAASLSKHTIYQDSIHLPSKENKASPSAIDSKNNNPSEPTPQIQAQQLQDFMYSYTLNHQHHQHPQQQYVYASPHCINQTATAPVPMSSYYPMYAPPSQQLLHQHMDQQYPIYLLPVPQNQSYSMNQQANIADATVVASSRPPTPPNATTVVASSPATNKEAVPPVYPVRSTTPVTKPEIASTVYTAVATATPTLVQIPPTCPYQHQQQFVGLSQMVPPPSETAAPVAPLPANYAFKYVHPVQDYSYYPQHQVAAPSPSQYQSMTPAAAVFMSQASSQGAQLLPDDNISKQTVTSQSL